MEPSRRNEPNVEIYPDYFHSVDPAFQFLDRDYGSQCGQFGASRGAYCWNYNGICYSGERREARQTPRLPRIFQTNKLQKQVWNNISVLLPAYIYTGLLLAYRSLNNYQQYLSQ